MNELILTNELLENILEFIKIRRYSYITYNQYSARLIAFFKKYKVLNRENLMHYLKKIKYPSERTILTLINEYCFQENIDFRITIPRMISKERKFPKTLQIEEIKLMILSAPKPYDLMLRCIFNIGGGLRISEAIKLSWNHFRWIEWLKEKEDGILVIKDTKRGKNIVVNVPKQLMNDLYLFAIEKDLLNEWRVPVGGVVFPMGIGEWQSDLYQYDLEKWKQEYLKHSYDWFRYNILKKYCEKAIGKKINVHMLRHSRATDLLDQGIPIERIRELMGHSKIETTMIYAKMNPKKTLEVVKGINEI